MTKPVDPLLTMDGRNWLLNSIMETPPEDLEKTCNIQLLNLLCVDNLQGSENLDVRDCLSRLDSLTDFIRDSIHRTYKRYGASADYSYCKYKTWMACLVTRMKQSFGVCYNPHSKSALDAGLWMPFTDTKEVFIHGMLGGDPNRRWGTCSSIPVLVTAIARKLGYPVRLACARNHLYCRWENDKRCFNIEASNAMGMVVESDEYYRQYRGGMPPELLKSGFYFRSLTPSEEFAQFMIGRVVVMRDTGRMDETFYWVARALQFAPDMPFASYGCEHAQEVLRYRLKIKYPGVEVKGEQILGLRDLLAPQERSFVPTIQGHHYEYNGDLNTTRMAYENACRQNVQGTNEHRDLQRFLKKYDLPRKTKPLILPHNLRLPRNFALNCAPVHEAEVLCRWADTFEKQGEPLKARDALNDLYLFDPGDAEVFQRARALEKLPLFQEQLHTLIEQHHSELESQGKWPPKPPPPAPADAFNLKGPLNIVNLKSIQNPHWRPDWNRN